MLCTRIAFCVDNIYDIQFNHLWLCNIMQSLVTMKLVFEYIFRPATHPDLIGISRFFSTNLGVSRFPDSMCENPEFLFRFEIGKTKGRLTLLHGP